MENKKQCRHCHENKELGEFHADRRTKDGRQSWCMKCVKEYQKNNEWWLDKVSDGRIFTNEDISRFIRAKLQEERFKREVREAQEVNKKGIWFPIWKLMSNKTFTNRADKVISYEDFVGHKTKTYAIKEDNELQPRNIIASLSGKYSQRDEDRAKDLPTCHSDTGRGNDLEAARRKYWPSSVDGGGKDQRSDSGQENNI